MIIVKITGGLGNQMFQYAAGLARAYAQADTLALDLSAYRESKKRSFGLGHFNIQVQESNIFQCVLHKYFLPQKYLAGEFQDEQYFKNIADLVRQEFRLKESLEKKYPDLVQEIAGGNSVSVHVRRTDYLDKQHRYLILSPEYYTCAMSIISQKIPLPKYYFFSDDIEWTKANISHPDNSAFLSHQDFEDLALMGMCKHQIVANSTFSWWAAWLNENPDKIVVAPEKWFTDINGATAIPMPETWIKI